MRESFLPPTKKNLRMPENADRCGRVDPAKGKQRNNMKQQHTHYLPFFFLVGIVQRFET